MKIDDNTQQSETPRELPFSRKLPRKMKFGFQAGPLIPKDKLDFLNARRWPARLNVEQTATALAIPERIITRLASAGLLPTCGALGANSIKYFATVTVLRLANDEKWLNMASEFGYECDKRP